MAARSQDYVSLGGHMTTNTVEGFHGLALMYGDKDRSRTHALCLQDKYGSLSQGEAL